MDFLLQKNHGESPPIKIDLNRTEVLIDSNAIQALSKYARVSESHASLSKYKDEWYIEDVGSKYGIYVDTTKVGKMPRKLKYYDIIGLGSKPFMNEAAFTCVLLPWYVLPQIRSNLYHLRESERSRDANSVSQECNKSELINNVQEHFVVGKLNSEYSKITPHIKMINYEREDRDSSGNETIPYVPDHNSVNETVPYGSVDSSLDSFKPKKKKKRYFTEYQEPVDTNWKINSYFESMDNCNSVAEHPTNMKVSESESTLLQNIHYSDTQSKSSIESMNIIKYPSQSVLLEIERMKKKKSRTREQKIQNLHNLSKKKTSIKHYKVDPETSGLKLKLKSVHPTSKSKLSHSNKGKRKKSLLSTGKESNVIQTHVKAAGSKKYKVDSSNKKLPSKKNVVANSGNKKLSSKTNEVSFHVNRQQPHKNGSVCQSSEENKSITSSNRCRNKASCLVKKKGTLVTSKTKNYGSNLKSLKTDVKSSIREQSSLQYKEHEKEHCKNIEKATVGQQSSLQYKKHKKKHTQNIEKVTIGEESCLQYKKKHSKNIEKATIKSAELQKQTDLHKQRDARKHFSIQYTSPVTLSVIKSNLPGVKSGITMVDKELQSKCMVYSSSSNEITKTCMDMEQNKSEIDNNKSMAVSFNKETENYYFKFIRRIVEMNTKWLREREYYKELNKEPPEISKGATLLPTSFDSYDAYASYFFPMIILEVWEEVCRKSKPVLMNENERKFLFCIFSSSNKNGLLKLQCESIVISNISYEPLKNNVVTLNLKFSSRAQCTVFGFITNHEYREFNREDLGTVEWNNLSSNYFTNSKLLKFDVYVKSREAAPLLRTLMDGNGLCSLEHKIKLVDALDNLKFSPLLNDVLIPNWKTFSVACSGKVSSSHYMDIRDSVTESVCKEMRTPSENKIILLQGPPGSGKTDMIITILESLIHDHIDKKRILVTAPSNAAINEIGNQLIELNERSGWRDVTLKFVRVGPLWNINENLKPYALAEQLELRRQNAEKERIRRELEYCDIQKHLFSLQGVAAENNSEVLNELELKCQCIQKKIPDKWDALFQMTVILRDADVILSTLEDCVQLNKIKDSLDLSCCIVDEINQTTELEILLPLALGINKIFITGDPMQLPAIVESDLAVKYGFQRSVLERFHMYFMSNFRKSPLIILTEQFRMNPSVWYFPLKYIYHKDIPLFVDGLQRNPHFPLKPYIVLDDKTKWHSCSAEYDHTGLAPVIKICNYVLEKCHLTSIGIIVPSNEAKERFSAAISNAFCHVKIDVDTVYGFQGKGKPVIILTCFQDEMHERQSYFSCIKQLNVALTRASRSLILCGSFNSVVALPEMDRLISDAVMRGCYFSYNSIDVLSSILKQHLSRRM